MNSSKTVRLVSCQPDFNDKLDAVYDRVTGRAFEKWLSRTAVRDFNTARWRTAEMELLVQPMTEVNEWAHGVMVRLHCGNLDPDAIRVFITPIRMLVLGPLPAGDDRWLFRLVDFKAPVDVADASVHYSNGVLEFSATVDGAPDEQKVHFKVA